MKICKHNDGLGRCGISGEYCVEGPCHCEELIEYEPVRHGRWVCGDYYDIGDVCSECDWDSGVVNPTLRYCPNCGAKMDGDSHD